MRRGEYPSFCSRGIYQRLAYQKCYRGQKRAPIIRQAFELYAEGNHRLKDVSDFGTAQYPFKKRQENPYHQSVFYHAKSFYTGLFRYAGEIHEGKYEPIIAKNFLIKFKKS